MSKFIVNEEVMIHHPNLGALHGRKGIIVKIEKSPNNRHTSCRVAVPEKDNNVKYYWIGQNYLQSVSNPADPKQPEILENALDGRMYTSKIILSRYATIYIINNKYKGVAKCNPLDNYDRLLGIELAKLRAEMSMIKDKIKAIV